MSTIDYGEYTVTTTVTPNGKTETFAWKPGTPGANQQTILQNVLAAQSQIQAWIAANPAGAQLTAAQTLVLARMLNGLCRILLAQFDSTTGT